MTGGSCQRWSGRGRCRDGLGGGVGAGPAGPPTVVGGGGWQAIKAISGRRFVAYLGEQCAEREKGVAPSTLAANPGSAFGHGRAPDGLRNCSISAA
ncbi:hypothetical protein GCM10027074_05990 [Streptomyces deserti]